MACAIVCDMPAKKVGPYYCSPIICSQLLPLTSVANLNAFASIVSYLKLGTQK